MHMEGLKRKERDSNRIENRPYRILIEANKLFMSGNDGVKRYLTELLESLLRLEQKEQLQWEIDWYVQGVLPFKLKEGLDQLEAQKKRMEQQIEVVKGAPPFEIRMLQLKEKFRKVLPTPLYRAFKLAYEYLPFRKVIRGYTGLLTQRELKRLKSTLDRYDLIHIPLPQNFHYLQYAEGRFLVTVHDLSHRHFPAFHTSDNRARSEKGMQWVCEKQVSILAVSEATKADIIKEYSIPPRRIQLVYGSYNPTHFYPRTNVKELEAVLKKYNLPNIPYLLTLSTLEPRKNLVNTLKAFNAFRIEYPQEKVALFVCGKKGWNYDKVFSTEVVSNKHIFFPGFIAEADLPVLYSHALALCYVSFYEGFGLPPLEAMACGTTVIYGNNSSMPEVIGEAGLPAEASDLNSIQEQIAVVVLDPKKRAILREKAQHRALGFSRQRLATSTLSLYKKIIDSDYNP